MPIDKDKIAKNALRFIQKGQFLKAIEEYQRVLSSDPRDIRTRLKLIDLYGRMGRKKEAIDECLQVSESYADQGFYLKAIAVYKQALRIDGENPALFRNVGELYIKQGLVGDALGAFKKAVDLLRARGQSGETEKLLARMEEMAPENAAIKIHLAEFYLSEGKCREFEAELSKIVLQLKGEGRLGRLLQAVEGFYERSNHHASVLKGLAELYADLHEEEKSLQLVHEGLSRTPGDRDLRLLGLRTNLTLGNLAEARRIALSLYEEDPHDLFVLEQLASIAQARDDHNELAHAYKAVAKVYELQGSTPKAELYHRKVLELIPDDAEARLALGDVVVDKAPARPPKRKEEELRAEGEAVSPIGSDTVHDELVEAELYLKYGLTDKAAERLRALVDRTPDDIAARQKLRDLYQRRGDRNGWVREQLLIGDLHMRLGQENDALRACQAVLEIDPKNAEARKAIHRLKPEAFAAAAADIQIDVDGTMADLADEAAVATPGQGRPARKVQAEEADLQQRLAEADFYEAQDQKEEAFAILLRLKEAHPDTPAVLSRLRRLGQEEERGDEFVDLQAEVLDGHSGLEAGFAGFQDFEVSELDDIVREFKSGIAAKLGEADCDTHYNLGLAYKEMGLLEDAVQEFKIASRFPEKAREAYTSIAMVCREAGKRDDALGALRMALAVPSNGPEDRAAILYEIGDVSEEDGDGEGALKAFERAAQIDPAYRDLSRRVKALRARSLV